MPLNTPKYIHIYLCIYIWRHTYTWNIFRCMIHTDKHFSLAVRWLAWLAVSAWLKRFFVLFRLFVCLLIHYFFICTLDFILRIHVFFIIIFFLLFIYWCIHLLYGCISHFFVYLLIFVFVFHSFGLQDPRHTRSQPHGPIKTFQLARVGGRKQVNEPRSPRQPC